MNTNLLRAKMVSAGYTQSKLALKIGMSQNTLSAKINGKSAFDVLEINKICEALNISRGSEKADIFLSESSQNRDELRGF